MDASDVEKEVKLEDAMAKYLKENLHISVIKTGDYYGSCYVNVSLILDGEEISCDSFSISKE